MQKLFYTKLARYYDRIYHYIDYEKQADSIVKLIKIFNKSGNNRLLDVACGTGIHANILQNKGFNVVGLDISEDMLKEAEKKNSRIRFIRGNMRKFNLHEKFGAIICFFNSILYNKNKKELSKTLLNFNSHLEKNGILIFDFIERNIGINSKKEKYKYDEGNLKIDFCPQWVYNKKENVMDLEIELTINGKKYHDHHIMGAFSFDELKKILQKNGFRVLRIDEKFHKYPKSAIFVARKE